MFKIEKEVPLPDKKQKYPFPEMAVGDSFFFEGSPKVGGQVRTAAAIYCRRKGAGKHFVIRTVPGGFRCWRDK